MKKLLTLCLTLVLFLSIPLSLSAATVDVANDILAFNDYYNEKETLTLFEETIALASVEQLIGKTPFYPEQDNTPDSLAKRILAYTAAGTAPEGFTEPETLSGMQGEDGSFGNTETHCLAMLALQAAKTQYNSRLAYKNLIARQGEDGSFDGSAKNTALAITTLSLSENESEQTAMIAARDYLIRYKANNAEDLCWQIIGISDSGENAATAGDRSLVETLIGYRTENNTYKLTADSKDPDEKATAMALIALNAVSQDASAFKRLAENGELTKYNKEDFRLLLILAVVLLVISIVFWIFIFLHKKNTKTLEETKLY